MADKHKRPGSWEEVEKFQDPSSGIGVVISKRIRGKPSYSFGLVEFDAMGTNKFVSYPPRGAHSLKDILYSLGKEAEERIVALQAADPEFKRETKKTGAA